MLSRPPASPLHPLALDENVSGFVIFPPVRQQKSGQAGRRRRRQGAISGSCCYLLHVNPQLVGGRFSLSAFLGGHILNIEKQSEEEED